MTPEEAKVIFESTEDRDDLTGEQKKYFRAWQVDSYRNYSPGEGLVEVFLETYTPEPGSTIIDYGCGPGRAGKRLYEAGLDVTMIDFVDNSLDEGVKELTKNNPRLKFVQADLSQPLDVPFAQYGFNCDVMEHIPEESVDVVLNNILTHSAGTFFQICNTHENYGQHPAVKEELHMTVKDYFYWSDKFNQHMAVVRRSNLIFGYCLFYVSKVDVTGTLKQLYREGK